MADATYLLGLDYGNVRIGVAVASTVARLPRPLTTLNNTEQVFDEIAELIQQESVGLIVVGLPRGMDGGYTAQTHAAERFAQQLAKRLSIPVELADETLTSIDAEAELAGKPHNKAAVDALAATYILERYFAEHPAPTPERLA
ncbi:MAG TPA: Holliday junction resolvase RuvX [Candidatus Saccharimonadales bacterium]|nr:Holliday junction resolvase RuvX [Candidatus Saccharimonadales bacterium]